MFSVRIPQSLRRAVKLAAVENGATIEAWVEDALWAALAK
jgi:predicted HicB family RNase H-like nuclease